MIAPLKYWCDSHASAGDHARAVSCSDLAVRGTISARPTNKNKALAKRNRKSTQVCKTRTCVRICDGRPNGFASRLTSSRKSQKDVISRLCRWLAINLCWIALGGHTVKTYVNLRTNLSSTKVNASPRKSSQVHTSPRKWVAKRNASWMSKQKSKTYVDLRVRGQGLTHCCNYIFQFLLPWRRLNHTLYYSPCIESFT